MRRGDKKSTLVKLHVSWLQLSIGRRKEAKGGALQRDPMAVHDSPLLLSSVFTLGAGGRVRAYHLDTLHTIIVDFPFGQLLAAGSTLRHLADLQHGK